MFVQNAKNLIKLLPCTEKKNIALEKQNKNLKKKLKDALKNMKSYEKRTTKHVTKLSTIKTYISSLNISEESKIFCKLLISKRPKEYSDEVKWLAQNIFYVSQSTYTFLRDKLNLNIPHVSTLHRWAPIKFLQPGFINNAIEELKLNIKLMDGRDKGNVVLLFDEIAIKRELRYNSKLDLIDGFEDLGFRRNSNIGKQVCVFMVRSLFSNWKLIFNYFVTENGLSGEDLKTILLKNIQILSELEITVRAVVCDQGPSNRKAYSLLGVSHVKPYMFINSIKIFCLYDFPHLIKSLRNCLLKSDLNTPDGLVSFEVVKELWQLEQNGKTRMCPKLTSQHIFPTDFDKMRVKYATQIFSRTVSAAIGTVIETCGFRNCSKEVAVSTKTFLSKIDQVFDCMNSGSLNSDNFYRSAIQKNNCAHEFLKTFKSYIAQVSLVQRSKTVYFLKGIEQSINGVLQLADDLFNDCSEDIFFLLTKRLNQDALENLFAVIRQKGGNNQNPSLYEFNIIIAKVMATNIIQSSSLSNCEEDNDSMLNIIRCDENVSLSISAAQNDQQYDKKLPDFDILEKYPDFFVGDHFENEDIEMKIDLVSMRYFIGYVAFKVGPKINCETCCARIKKSDEVISAPSELFLFQKNYSRNSDFGNLNAPSDQFFEISKKHILVFDSIFSGSPDIKHIREKIVEKCKKATNEWFSNDSCLDHKMKLVEFLVLVLLRKKCSWKMDEIKSKSKRKTKILVN